MAAGSGEHSHNPLRALSADLSFISFRSDPFSKILQRAAFFLNFFFQPALPSDTTSRSSATGKTLELHKSTLNHLPAPALRITSPPILDPERPAAYTNNAVGFAHMPRMRPTLIETDPESPAAIFHLASAHLRPAPYEKQLHSYTAPGPSLMCPADANPRLVLPIRLRHHGSQRLESSMREIGSNRMTIARAPPFHRNPRAAASASAGKSARTQLTRTSASMWFRAPRQICRRRDDINAPPCAAFTSPQVASARVSDRRIPR
ncbi:hypothetical protein DFH09DRAFT_1329906 [Mycena vulgaris]|nr:hypothetical protein DFH09DRAFT_1329906 [Mycena vulgaris]